MRKVPSTYRSPKSKTWDVIYTITECIACNRNYGWAYIMYYYKYITLMYKYNQNYGLYISTMYYSTYVILQYIICYCWVYTYNIYICQCLFIVLVLPFRSSQNVCSQKLHWNYTLKKQSGPGVLKQSWILQPALRGSYFNQRSTLSLTPVIPGNSAVQREESLTRYLSQTLTQHHLCHISCPRSVTRGI